MWVIATVDINGNETFRCKDGSLSTRPKKAWTFTTSSLALDECRKLDVNQYYVGRLVHGKVVDIRYAN